MIMLTATMGSTYTSLHLHIVFSTKGYAAFSVSAAHREALRRYISGQETHHREFVFIDELKRLLVENGVPYDPKYLL